MNGQVVVAALCLVALSGCECGKRQQPKDTPPAEAVLPPGFDRVMADHEGLAFVARDALIRGDLERARQSMRKLAFFMEHTPYPDGGKDFARITKALAAEVRSGRDLEEACMAFARLSHACGQCHHTLNRGPPVRLDPVPEGSDVKTHMRRHYWAVERMWEALLTDSPRTFQRAARVLAEAPLHGERVPDSETPAGVSRLGFEVHDLAFAAAVEGSNVVDDYVPGPGERRASRPTTRGQAEIFGQILYTCNQCHEQLGVTPTLPGDPQPQGDP
ncbi:MAG: hypothetical protein AAF436_09280 [Myxococcota bacterium]